MADIEFDRDRIEPVRRERFRFIFTEERGAVYDLIDQERDRQDIKWGQQNHDILEWMGVIAEEFGELVGEMVKLHFVSKYHQVESGMGSPKRRKRTYEEAVQLAATAMVFIEYLDRTNPDGTGR